MVGSHLLLGARHLRLDRNAFGKLDRFTSENFAARRCPTGRLIRADRRLRRQGRLGRAQEKRRR